MNVNKQTGDVLNALVAEPSASQRVVSELSGHSLGVVNRSLKELKGAGYLDEKGIPTEKTTALCGERSPRRAIILAAGYGMRMVPINTEIPKAFLEVRGERLIERQIKHLHEVRIKEISVVVGFKKELFEYLIDEFGVELIVNSEYATKNNLHSLRLAAKRIQNAYILPCDIWCKENPFRKRECYSWYMVKEEASERSDVRANRKSELVHVPERMAGNAMTGIAYLCGEDAERLQKQLVALDKDKKHEDGFWETALFAEIDRAENRSIFARVVPSFAVVGVNTYEQLRALDKASDQLKSEAITVIERALQVNAKEIKHITVLKKGMTNRSFLFECRGKRYIMRIPGEGTDKLINRRQEASVYQTIDGMGICDDVAYINPENGFKITEYLEGARVCDPLKDNDVKKCMQKLRAFHERGLKVAHEFSIFQMIDFYENLWGGKPSVYRDYAETKRKVLSLKSFLEQTAGEKVLTHIDAVPDNFLFVDGEGGEEIRLIDWEYAGMQDPHVDIAMFAIYSLYNRSQIERLIDCYFPEGCAPLVRVKIYGYIAACGLLWSNWCEYKSQLGVEFGEYSLKQYRYAKEYYRVAEKEIEKCIK